VRYFKNTILLTALIYLIGALSVHMFSKEFAGKLTKVDNSKLIAKGERLYKDRACINCHGAGGNNPTNEDWPNLSGQPQKYLEAQIKDIRDGRRKNGTSAMMAGSIKSVTNDEVYLISLYLSEM
jgi:cytochrome c553